MKYAWRTGAVTVLDDGRWAIGSDAATALRQTRSAVRERIAVLRRSERFHVDPAVLEANRIELERQRASHAAELAELSRVLIVAYPRNAPRYVVLVDVATRALRTFVSESFDELRDVLSDYEVLGGVDVRTQLRVLDVPLGAKHLAELGPPQKTMQLDPRGSKLKITTALLAQGSLRLKKPFAEPATLDAYVAAGASTKLVRRLEADAKSLYALYQYGRLHGAVRLRCGFVDELIPAPWVHRDEPKLHDLKSRRLTWAHRWKWSWVARPIGMSPGHGCARSV